MDNFYVKSREVITKAIESKEKYVYIYIKWISPEIEKLASNLFSSYLSSSQDNNSEHLKLINETYNKLKEEMFEKYGASLYFGGCDIGSHCSIIYPIEPTEENFNRIKNRLNECYDILGTYDKISVFHFEKRNGMLGLSSAEFVNIIYKIKKELKSGYKIDHKGFIMKIN